MRALLLLLLLNFGIGYGQTLSGYVYDEAENKPLEGAFVYIDGTTLSASTDAKGYFKIVTAQKYNAPLVVKYMGFETLTVNDPYQYNGPIKVLLREDAIQLNEVVITKGGPFTRKQMLKAFRKQFLGDRGGSRCKIENEDDIILHFDTKDNTLHAKAFKPIIINNKYLEYKVAFDLNAFQANYNYLTLNDENIRGSFFAGTTFFTDLSEKGGADKKRKEAYLGSSVHFMRAVADNNWQKENYQLYVDKIPADHKEFFKVTDTVNLKRVELIAIPQSVKDIRASIAASPGLFERYKANHPEKYSDVKLMVVHGKEQTALNFHNGVFYIDENGLFFPLQELTFGGYMGELKAGDLLPADYKYTP
ncbi:carboxypeptidase-like regulatory domain-containing protein [Flavobacterium zepuense]|uniref:Carboxypeptidase-like regulatory domain-containing protein n=1 Tax=Flavobacterium zepuense TaxID=2593302 RepID=A0A552V2B5_9FLAO|nr:carboxypeptidase-like regulatory domain-containing protein [Flavobacterium zepuense]TRW24612.1 carboxypeptidase-like regulatory domain-containing protein [Flavobacterium zepuense]